MSNTLYNYLDPDFHLDQTGKYTLLLWVTATHFSSAVVDNGKLLAWVSNYAVDELKDSSEADDLLKANYAQVLAGVSSNKFTLWPQHLVEPEQTATIARFLDIKDTDSICTDDLNSDNKVIYTVPQALVKFLKKYQLEHKIQFAPKGWLKAITQHFSSEHRIYINVSRTQADILYLKDNQIIFYNNFPFNTADELVYYAALAAQELHLDYTTTSVKISGDVKAGDACMSRLAEFFKGAELTTLQVLNLPSTIPSQQILALSALSLCASLVEA